MKRWYLVCEEDSSVLYREVFGPFKTLGAALEAIPRVKRSLQASGSEWDVKAEHMYEYYALARSSEYRIEETI